MPVKMPQPVLVPSGGGGPSFAQPVLVRNEEPGPTVFTDRERGVAIDWQAKGDPSGEDVQYVPAEVVISNTNFLKMLNRGIFTVVDADEVTQAALDAQRAAHERRRQIQQEAAQASITQRADNDYLSVQCLGPNNQGNGQCDQQVAVSAKATEEKPPLCTRHQALTPEFAMVEGEFDNESGRPKRSWKRMQVGPRA